MSGNLAECSVAKAECVQSLPNAHLRLRVRASNPRHVARPFRWGEMIGHALILARLGIAEPMVSEMCAALQAHLRQHRCSMALRTQRWGPLRQASIWSSN